MSCGCGCCPKCGCQATCTCNQSLWFDETMADVSYTSMKTLAGETGKSGANCGYYAGTCYANEASSDCFSSQASENGTCAKEGEIGEITFE